MCGNCRCMDHGWHTLYADIDDMETERLYRIRLGTEWKPKCWGALGKQKPCQFVGWKKHVAKIFCDKTRSGWKPAILVIGDSPCRATNSSRDAILAKQRLKRTNTSFSRTCKKDKLLCFEWSPPWHFKTACWHHFCLKLLSRDFCPTNYPNHLFHLAGHCACLSVKQDINMSVGHVK